MALVGDSGGYIDKREKRELVYTYLYIFINVMFMIYVLQKQERKQVPRRGGKLGKYVE